MKLGDIKGESTDSEHEDWIDVTGYSHRMTDHFFDIDTTQHLAGKPIHEPFIFTRVFSTASPDIMDAYLNETLLGVTFEIHQPGGSATGATRRLAMTVNMTNATIASYRLDYLDPDDDGDGIPVETIGLRYESIDWKVEEGESLRSEWYDPSMAPKTRASFIKFDGIDGESKDVDHDGWSDLVTVRYSVSEEIDGATGHPTGKTEVSSVVVVKPVDASSPFLLMSVARGDTYDVTIERYQPDATADSGRVHYLTIELTNASVERAESIDNDCDNDCDGSWDDREEISLRFESIKWTWELLGIEHEDIG
jgi:type VI secretion system secreted protein Hcp